MGMDTRYVRNQDFVFRTINHEAILVPIKENVGDMGCIYSLNEVGAFVWEQLDGRKTIGDVKNLVLEAFDGVPASVDRDLQELVEQLSSIDAVRESDGVA